MFGFIDWNNPKPFEYIVMGGGGVLVFALLLYLIPSKARSRLKVPAIIFAILGSLAIGFAGGALGMAWYGERIEKKAEGDQVADRPDGPPGGRMPGGMPGGGMPGGGRPGGGRPGGGMPGMPGMPGGFGGGRGGPQSASNLDRLVDKLSALLDRPIELTLDSEQRKAILAQLEGIEKVEKLGEEDAKKRFEALEKALDDQKGTLAAAGFRWPGQRQGRPGQGDRPPREGENPPPGGNRPPAIGGGGPRTPPDNPFKGKSEQLDDLRARLKEAKPEKDKPTTKEKSQK